ncbi:response regulator transcription factor [Paraburkholderia strydomiana]|jgi:DNA-binding response OmpR family regulator|uniref:Response regulator transcription factor n=1 Tax=Paraburkholderia strydomiana TaxID=1245417 RepID=A0ABW9EA54_9BURK
MKVAVLEDSREIREFVSHQLTSAGYQCQEFVDSRSLLDELRRQTFDLLVLDWMLPDRPGTEVLHWVRANLPRTLAVLFLTSRASDDDMSSVLNSGADDYLVKPVTSAMLLARTRALLRRCSIPAESSGPQSFDDFEFDSGRGELRLRGTLISLTPKQFALALLLFQHLDDPLPNAQIIETVWRRAPDEPALRTLSTHASMLRTKLGLRPQNGYRLMPIYGYGYRLQRVPSG